jgi:hypothetical protein
MAYARAIEHGTLERLAGAIRDRGSPPNFAPL